MENELKINTDADKIKLVTRAKEEVEGEIEADIDLSDIEKLAIYILLFGREEIIFDYEALENSVDEIKKYIYSKLKQVEG